MTQANEVVSGAGADAEWSEPKPRPFVVGEWRYEQATDRVAFYAVEGEPGKPISDTRNLTPRVGRWYSWRSRQAAYKWRNGEIHRAHLTVLNFGALKVKRDG